MVAGGLLFSGAVHAQYALDMLQLSQFQPVGSARFTALGGSFAALGADWGGATMNPAGLAGFHTSVLGLSASLGSEGARSEYLSNSVRSGRGDVRIPSLGIVVAEKPQESGSGWRRVHFGFTLNQTAVYSGRWQLNGLNLKTSLVNYFQEEANSGVAFVAAQYPFTAALAARTGLIYPQSPGDSTSYYFSIVSGGGVRQKEEARSGGQMSDYQFTLAGNWQNRLHFGVSLSILSARFDRVTEFSETDEADTILKFKSLRYIQSIYTVADGFELKLGAIFKPTEALRLGFSYVPPSRLTVEEDFQTDLEATLDSVPTYAYASSPVFAPFEYKFRRPARTSVGLAVVVRNKGLITAGYDHMSFQRMRVRTEGLDAGTSEWARGVNSDVNALFSSTGTFRLGGEGLLGPYAFRVGMAYTTSPFLRELNTGGGNRVQREVSLGAGYRKDPYMVDLCVSNRSRDIYREPYTLSPPSPNFGASIRQYRTELLLSLGMRF
ncbi:MAG: hypothetical protein FJ344_02685 [Sphingomonadales bacterium]|nr:hypothetical protein [Sphingomonadales bacterium]